MLGRAIENKLYLELYNRLKEKDKEIERLNQEIRGLNNCIIEFHSKFCNKQAEINRLNNIINELEKTLIEWHEYWEDDDCNCIFTDCDVDDEPTFVMDRIIVCKDIVVINGYSTIGDDCSFVLYKKYN
jgi:DNA repair exonuclease SbcCD ATPase subunit